jgi:hypothetical protein
VRRTKRGLGRLAGDAGVLGAIGLASFAAAGAHAAPAPQVFFLTIKATAVADFDHTSAPVASSDCRSAVRAEGVRTATFRSSPTPVRFVGGRLQTVTLRNLTGTIKLTGANTHNEVCGPKESHTAEPCTPTTRTFRNGRVTFSGPEAGTVAIRTPDVSLRRIGCPQEPAELLQFPLGPAPGPLHLAVRALTNPRTTRITLTATASRTRNYGSPEDGMLQQRTNWSFTLARRH